MPMPVRLHGEYCLFCVVADSKLEPIPIGRWNAPPIHESFASETLGRPNGNVPIFFFRCFPSPERSHCRTGSRVRCDNAPAVSQTLPTNAAPSLACSGQRIKDEKIWMR